MLTVHPTLLIGPSDWLADRMPKEEFLRRIDALWRVCPAASRAIVYGDSCHHAELAYLTNFVPKLEPAVALISATGDHRLLVGGGANMLSAAKPLTWIGTLAPLGNGSAIGEWAAGEQGEWPSLPVMIGAGHMTSPLRATIADALPHGEAPTDATANLWALMRRKSSYELLAVREACLALRAAVAAIATAKRAGAGVTAAVLAGERAANLSGAQDVRTLFSVNGGRTLTPFTAPVDQSTDPLQVYVAVRRFNYWAEGFFPISDRRQPIAEKAAELLRFALTTAKTGSSATDVASLIGTAMRPYRSHPVTERAFANSIGLTLDDPPYTNVAIFEPGEIYSLKVGITDTHESHAIVSAMIRIRDDGNEVLWSMGDMKV